MDVGKVFGNLKKVLKGNGNTVHFDLSSGLAEGAADDDLTIVLRNL